MGTITEKSIETEIKSNLVGNELFAIDDPNQTDLTVTTSVENIRLSIAQDILPIGAVVPFFVATPPGPQWLSLDGSAISRITFAELFAIFGTTFGVGDGSTTFNLPDTRGRFMRGLDTTGTIDPDGAGRTLGDNQPDAMQGHWHNVRTNDDTSVVGKYSGTASGSSYLGYTLSASSSLTSPAYGTGLITDGVNGTPRTSSETRPVNISVNYFVKALR